MEDYELFWIFLGILILAAFLYNFFSCVGGCNPYGVQYLNNNEYTLGEVSDFCGIDNINYYFNNRNECCSAKISCGNGKRGSWSDWNKKCIC